MSQAAIKQRYEALKKANAARKSVMIADKSGKRIRQNPETDSAKAVSDV